MFFLVPSGALTPSGVFFIWLYIGIFIALFPDNLVFSSRVPILLEICLGVNGSRSMVSPFVSVDTLVMF